MASQTVLATFSRVHHLTRKMKLSDPCNSLNDLVQRSATFRIKACSFAQYNVPYLSACGYIDQRRSDILQSFLLKPNGLLLINPVCIISMNMFRHQTIQEGRLKITINGIKFQISVNEEFLLDLLF